VCARHRSVPMLVFRFFWRIATLNIDSSSGMLSRVNLNPAPS
jgi:hypothetical protein